MLIQLPQRCLFRKQSVKGRPKRTTVNTNVGSTPSALEPQRSRIGVGIRPVVTETPLTPVTPAGNIGKLDGNSTACEVELSSDCQKKAEASVWYVPRH